MYLGDQGSIPTIRINKKSKFVCNGTIETFILLLIYNFNPTALGVPFEKSPYHLGNDAVISNKDNEWIDGKSD